MYHHHALGQELARAHQANHLAEADGRRAGRQVATARRAERRTAIRRRLRRPSWAVRLIGRPAV